MNGTGNNQYISAEPVPTGFVYFMQAGDAIKIGFSIRPWDRAVGLQVSHAEDLVVLACFEGTKKDEGELHRRFSHLCIRGELFHPEEELLAYIGSLVPYSTRKSRLSDETLEAIGRLIEKRSECGAKTPLGARYSNLIGQLRNYELGENREQLAIYISKTLADIRRLSNAA